MPAFAGAVDRRLMARMARPAPQPIDRGLTTLTRAADYGRLWLLVASLLAAFGNRRGRRAALHGMVAVGIASATVNGPLKLLFGRRRPAPIRRLAARMPRSPSFPSGHSASAFAFAVAASRELPEAAPALVPLAAGVAYSRVYLGVHYPSDVAAGTAVGAAIGMLARPAARRLGLRAVPPRPAVAQRLPREAVLVVSPRAGRSRRLASARRALDRLGIVVAEEVDVADLDRLPGLLRSTAGEPRLVIAAGGDGTVGSVAARLRGTDSVLGILPLGTGNDFARSLGIAMSPRRAARELAGGRISSVDIGRVTRDGAEPAYFVHAATVGLNVDFARLATRASVRARLGRLTYLAAAAYALRERRTFDCTIEHDGVTEELRLLQLSVISAPVVGGTLGLSVRPPRRPDHVLDVLAVGDVPPTRVLRAGLFLLAGIKRPVKGILAMQVTDASIASDRPLGLALDGELDGTLPGRIDNLAGAVSVVVPDDGA